MNRCRLIVLAVVIVTSTLLACSSDEMSPHPVPVDAGTEAARDGAPKGDGGSDHLPEGGAHDASAGG